MRAFNEDRYRDMQLQKYLEPDTSELSNCCDEEIDEHTGLCSRCKEPCITNTEEYENAMEDKADAQRELEREDD